MLEFDISKGKINAHQKVLIADLTNECFHFTDAQFYKTIPPLSNYLFGHSNNFSIHCIKKRLHLYTI